ncbi:hypothetical protein GCM10009679_07790 [Saccharothrix algeriensis]
MSTVGPALSTTYGTRTWPMPSSSSTAKAAPSTTVNPRRLMAASLAGHPRDPPDPDSSPIIPPL